MKAIFLRHGQTTATVCSDGAEIISFKGNDGREVLWQGDPAVWGKHAPVLFPVCGAVRDDQIKIAGQTYPMEKHGFTRDAAFAVCRQGDDYVDLVLTPTAKSKPMYPFDFAFHVTYQLFENGYTTTFLVENKSDRVMPFCLGGHPGFICPMEPGAAYEDYDVVFEKPESGQVTLVPGGYLATGTERLDLLREGRILSLSHDVFDERDTLIFAGLNSRSVDLVNRRSGHGLRFAFPKMEVLALWSMPRAHADYICLEPWHGLSGRVQDSDNFEDKPYVTLLDPGRVYTAWFTASLI